MQSNTTGSYGDLRDFRAQAADQGSLVTDQGPSAYHRGR
jgi:hypothetical protein